MTHMLKLRYVTDISRIAELKYIKLEEEEIIIGALTRISKLNDKQVIRKLFTGRVVFEIDRDKLLGNMGFSEPADPMKKLE